MHNRPNSLRTSVSAADMQRGAGKKSFVLPMGSSLEQQLLALPSTQTSRTPLEHVRNSSSTSTPTTPQGAHPTGGMISVGSGNFASPSAGSEGLSGPQQQQVDVSSLVPTFRPKTSPALARNQQGAPTSVVLGGAPRMNALGPRTNALEPDLSILKLLGESSPVVAPAFLKPVVTASTGSLFGSSTSANGTSIVSPSSSPLRVPQPPQPPSGRARVTIGDATFVGNTIVVDSSMQPNEEAAAVNAALTSSSSSVVAVALPAGKLDRLNLDQRFLKELPALQLPSGAAADHKTLSSLLSQVKLLNLQNNEIHSLSVPPAVNAGGAFASLLQPTPLSCFANVVYLDLYNNRLKNLNGLEQLRKLRVLMIGKNRLSDLSQLFKSVVSPTLEVLDAHGNQLTTFFAPAHSSSTAASGEDQVDQARVFPQLRVVNVAGNKLNSLDGVQYLPALSEFNARRNRVSSLPPKFGFHTRHVKKMFLSSNSFGHDAKDDLIRQLCSCRSMEELTLDSNPCFAHISVMDDTSKLELIGALTALKSLNGVVVTDQDRSDAARRRATSSADASRSILHSEGYSTPLQAAPLTPTGGTDTAPSTRSTSCVSPPPQQENSGQAQDVPSSAASSVTDVERPNTSPVMTSPTSSARRPSAVRQLMQITAAQNTTSPPPQSLISPPQSPLVVGGMVSAQPQWSVSLAELLAKGPRGSIACPCPTSCERLVLHTITSESLRGDFQSAVHSCATNSLQCIPQTVELSCQVPTAQDFRIWDFAQLLTVVRKQWPLAAILVQQGSPPLDWKPVISPVISGQASMGPPTTNSLWAMYKSAPGGGTSFPKSVDQFGHDTVAKGGRQGELLRCIDETLFAGDSSLLSTSSSLLASVSRPSLQQSQAATPLALSDSSQRRKMYQSCSPLVLMPRPKVASLPPAPQTPTELSRSGSTAAFIEARPGTRQQRQSITSTSSRVVAIHRRNSAAQPMAKKPPIPQPPEGGIDRSGEEEEEEEE